jgi:hypothetical protein
VAQRRPPHNRGSSCSPPDCHADERFRSSYGLKRIGRRGIAEFREETATLAKWCRASGDALERLDVLLRQWPVAGLTLLALAILMGAAMLAGG